MFNESLLLIYSLFLHRGGQKINWIEQYIGYDNRTERSSDDMKNEQSAYEVVFSEKNRPILEQLYMKLQNEMNGVTYQQCGDVLEALAFIQEMSATALWKYHQKVGVIIEDFVRDFDRLDVPEERIRLYQKTQKLYSLNKARIP